MGNTFLLIEKCGDERGALWEQHLIRFWTCRHILLQWYNTVGSNFSFETDSILKVGGYRHLGLIFLFLSSTLSKMQISVSLNESQHR